VLSWRYDRPIQRFEAIVLTASLFVRLSIVWWPVHTEWGSFMFYWADIFSGDLVQAYAAFNAFQLVRIAQTYFKKGRRILKASSGAFVVIIGILIIIDTITAFVSHFTAQDLLMIYTYYFIIVMLLLFLAILILTIAIRRALVRMELKGNRTTARRLTNWAIIYCVASGGGLLFLTTFSVMGYSYGSPGFAIYIAVCRAGEIAIQSTYWAKKERRAFGYFFSDAPPKSGSTGSSHSTQTNVSSFGQDV